MPRIKLCLLNFIVIFSLKILESESENRHLNDRILLQENRHEMWSKTQDYHEKNYGSKPLHTIVHPKRITMHRKFLEYATLDPFSEVRSDGKIRKRRSVDAKQAAEHLNPSKMTADGGHLVYYELNGMDSESYLHKAVLKLRRNYKLVSKNFIVEERGKGGKLMKRHNMVHDCHYTGVVENHEGFSKVAMSLCNGLQGIIHKGDETFFIEPKWNHTHEEGKPTPHYISKRNINEDLKKRTLNFKNETGCGVTEAAVKTSSSESSSRKKRSLRDEKKSRRRRSVSLERNVETLVVADKHMVAFHGRDDLQKYLLTIMNMVGSLYHDATIGNAVNIVVTRMILLVEDQPELTLNHHADLSMLSFCKWQSNLIANDDDNQMEFGSNRHDNAILITGLDICANDNAPCGTLGLARLNSMCDSKRSCNINEDTGIATAHTIAHEIGHNFGMEHDGIKNDCGITYGEPAKIMAGKATASGNPFQWSRCSRKYITDYLDEGNGECLLDSPPLRDFKFSEEMPGQIYDASEQCRFQFGASSRECSFGKSCNILWCVVNMTRSGLMNECITQNVPVAEGTNCTSEDVSEGWCNRGKCISFGTLPDSKDGAWGEWSPWSECSRTCGIGAASSSRTCDNPMPENGGSYCIGKRKRYQTCNTQNCPENSKDFRNLQCEVYDHELFRERYYNWEPFLLNFPGSMENPCALNCMAVGHSFFVEKSNSVIDGTQCYTDSKDICIAGECHHVGCDGVLNSEATEDKCRVCGGDGSSCVSHAGLFNGGDLGEYHYIVTIPKGSVNIHVEEIETSVKNFLALKGVEQIGVTDYLNSNWSIEWPRDFTAAGTNWNYRRPNNKPEYLSAKGPTDRDLILAVLLQETNLGVKYEYNVPVDVGSGNGLIVESAFLWEFGDWLPCSASCAGGLQSKPVFCKRIDDDTIVSNKYCDSRTTPAVVTRSCNMEPCPAQWFVGKWEECSSSCGGGTMDRLVVCMRAISSTEDETVSEHYCHDLKPLTEQACNTDSCPPEWVAGKWQRCSTTCGSGWKVRSVSCLSSDRTTQYEENMCDSRVKPVERTQCELSPCPPVRWRTSPWSSCSVTCGHGNRKRRVVCRQGNQSVSGRLCPRQRPKSIMSCSSRVACTTPNKVSSSIAKSCIDDPKVTYCRKVRRFGFCSRSFFKKMCCKSCQGR